MNYAAMEKQWKPEVIEMEEMKGSHRAWRDSNPKTSVLVDLIWSVVLHISKTSGWIFYFFFIRLFFFKKALQWFRQLMLRPVSRQLQSTAAIWQLHSGSAAASVDSWKLSGSVIARRRTWEWIFPSKPLSPDGRYGIKWMDRAEQRLNGMEDRLINSCWTF